VTHTTLASWHELVQTRNTKSLSSLLSEDIVFYSPVVHAPQVGKALALRYLSAAAQVLSDESFHYVRELSDSRGAVLEFQVELDGIAVNGVDMIKWDHDGNIVEFKVMIRPLKAINLIHQKMAALLVANQ
jgi:hypothetical protein